MILARPLCLLSNARRSFAVSPSVKGRCDQHALACASCRLQSRRPRACRRRPRGPDREPRALHHDPRQDRDLGFFFFLFSLPFFLPVAFGALGFGLAGPENVTVPIVGTAGGAVVGGCSRRRCTEAAVRAREPAVHPCVVDVRVPVGVLRDQLVARDEEHVVAVRARIQEQRDALLVPVEIRWAEPFSYSYTSSTSFTSRGDRASLESKNSRLPSSDRLCWTYRFPPLSRPPWMGSSCDDPSGSVCVGLHDAHTRLPDVLSYTKTSVSGCHCWRPCCRSHRPSSPTRDRMS